MPVRDQQEFSISTILLLSGGLPLVLNAFHEEGHWPQAICSTRDNRPGLPGCGSGRIIIRAPR
jgi:hypothetical protein